MKKHISLSSVWKIGLLILVVLHSILGLRAQAKPASGATGSAGVLLVDTDDSCRLVLDGKDQGVVKPDETKRIGVSLGEHILKCTVEGIPDLVWRKVIEVKNSEQVAALISLKALHIQYEEATSKLQKETSNPKVPAGIPEKTPKSTSASRTPDSGSSSLVGTWTVKTANGSGMYVFSADGSMSLTGRRNSGDSIDLRGRWSQNGGSLVLFRQGSQEASPPFSIRSIDARHVQLIIPGHEDETQDLERVSNNQSVSSETATCLNGTWREQYEKPLSWLFTVSGDTLTIRRTDNFVSGTLSKTGSNWTGQLRWGNGQVWPEIVLTPSADCTQVHTNQSWWYRR